MTETILNDLSVFLKLSQRRLVEKTHLCHVCLIASFIVFIYSLSLKKKNDQKCASPVCTSSLCMCMAKNKQVNGASICKAVFTDSSLVVSAQGRRLELDVLKESVDGGVG